MPTTPTTRADSPATVPTIDPSKDFIRQEYFFLQQAVEDYQKQSLDIKKLSLSLSAGIALFKGLTGIGANFALFSVLFLSLGFWLLDWLWKEFQRNHYHRLDEIETTLSNQMTFPPHISASWRIVKPHARSLPKTKAFELKSAFWPQVFIPHLPIASISGVAIVLSQIPTSLAPTP